jgi:predicted nucleic acid-binding protein
MIVVSNTTPLNYLILIGEIELLERLYGRILIPPAVLAELAAAKSPEAVRMWAGSLPGWVEVRRPSIDPDALLSRLQVGEREAILLACEVGADLLLIDERAGRRAGQSRRLHVAGTLALLMDAGWRGPVDFNDAIDRLAGTTFHASEGLLQLARARYAAGAPMRQSRPGP